MWIKKNNKLFNLERFDAVIQDKDTPDILWLVQANPTKKTAVAKYDEVQVAQVIADIAAAMQNGDKLYVLP
jgi:hypothetical protein